MTSSNQSSSNQSSSNRPSSNRPSFGRRLAVTGIAAGAIAAGLAGFGATTAQAATTSSLSCTDAAITAHYACSVSGTTDQTSVTLPLTHSAGVSVPTGTSRMASGAGTMTLTQDSVTFTFSPAYTATHSAPYSFNGGFTIGVQDTTGAGPFRVSVGGQTFVTDGPQGTCDTACGAQPAAHGTFKSAWDQADGRTHFELVRGTEGIVAGQAITFVDHAGAGQSQCTAKVQQQDARGVWTNVGVSADVDAAGTTLSATWTPRSVSAVRLLGSCATDGSRQVYSDNGTVSGIAVTAEAKVTGTWADGHGTTPAPKPTVTPKPTPKPTVTPKPVMVTETYQVDTATIRNSAVVLDKYLAADDDSRLVYRELGQLWQNRSLSKHFSEKHQYVTISVPATATAAQREAAINARTTYGDVHSTSKLGSTRASSGTVTYAWRLDTAHGARPVDGGAAWGPRHNLSQAFFARS